MFSLTRLKKFQVNSFFHAFEHSLHFCTYYKFLANTSPWTSTVQRLISVESIKQLNTVTSKLFKTILLLRLLKTETSLRQEITVVQLITYSDTSLLSANIYSNKEDESQREIAVYFVGSSRRLRQWSRFLGDFSNFEPISANERAANRLSGQVSADAGRAIAMPSHFVLPIRVRQNDSWSRPGYTHLALSWFQTAVLELDRRQGCAVNSKRATEWKARRTAPPAEISLPTRLVYQLHERRDYQLHEPLGRKFHRFLYTFITLRYIYIYIYIYTYRGLDSE